MKARIFAKIFSMLLVCGCGSRNGVSDSGPDTLELKTLEQKIDDLSKQVRDSQNFMERISGGTVVELSDGVIESIGLNSASDDGVDKLKKIAYKVNRKERLELQDLDRLKDALTKIETKRASLHEELFMKHWKGFLLYHGIVLHPGITQEQETAVREEWKKILYRQIDRCLTSREHRSSMKRYLKNSSESIDYKDWFKLEYYHKSMTPIEDPLLGGITPAKAPITSTQYTATLGLLREKEPAIICYHNILELAVLQGELQRHL